MANRSGETYSRSSLPPANAPSTRDRSGPLSELLKNSAASPLALAASTWSFISEISGLMTTHVPASRCAGSW